MRSTLCTMLVLLMTVLSFAVPAKNYERKFVTVSSSEMKLSFETGDYKIAEVTENGVTYSKLIDAGGVPVGQKGYADLPVLGATVQLGDKYDVVISFVDGDYTDIQLDHPLLPSRGTIYRNQDPSAIPYEIDPKSVRNEWFPKESAYSAEPFAYRDTRGVNVYVHPYQYNAVTKTLRVYKTMRVTMKEDVTKTTNPLTVKPTSIDASMATSYRSLYINYDESKFTNQIGEFGEMLVIYTSRDATVIQPYIEWKRQKGFKVTTSQVATGTNVKTTVANAYSSNPNILYVQLVGDWADIKCDLGGGDNSPMDPMLGCVVGTDWYPELLVGRFSANSTDDVTVQIDKAINYEKNPDMAGTWYKTGLGIGSPDGDGIGDDGEIDYAHVDIIKENKLLPYSYTTVNEAYGTPTATTIANYVNAGLGIINYCGHGANTYWVTSSYSNTNIASSTNGSKLPFIISVACVNGEFDVTTCFAEAWLRKSGGGAVATLMATINQPWVPPMVAQDYMNDILVGGYNYSTMPGDADYSPTAADHRTTFGSITMNGNVLMLAESYSDATYQNTIQTWTIFGDVAMQVRTDTPKAISFENAVTISSYSTVVTSGGQPVEGAMVSLYRNGTTVSGFTNSSGAITLAHSFNPGDQVTLTVSGYNLETNQTIQTVIGSTGGTYSDNQSSMNYGYVTVGGSSTMQFTITNSHNSEYLMGDITTVTGYSVGEATKNVLNYSVGPNSDKTFDLVFSPVAQTTYSGNIVITSTDTSHPTNNISVSGTGAYPDISLPSSAGATALPGGSITDSFVISNTGTSGLNYSLSNSYVGYQIPGGNYHSNDFQSGLVYTNSGAGSWTASTTGSGTWNGGTICASTQIETTNIMTSGGFDTSTAGGTVYLDFDYTYTHASGASGTIEYYTGSTWASVWTISAAGSGHVQVELPIKSNNTQIRVTGVMTKQQGGVRSYFRVDNFNVTCAAVPYSWLTFDSPTSGLVASSGSNTIDMTYDATGLSEGVYESDITVASDDPDEPSEVIHVTFTVGNDTPPSSPENITVVTATASEVNLGWDAVSGAATYHIYRSTEPYSGFTEIGTSGTNSYQDTDVLTGNKYFYYITAE